MGAVIMRAGQVIATGYNRPITDHDPDRPRGDRRAAPRGATARQLPAAGVRALRDARALRDVRDGDDACAASSAWCSAPPDPKTGVAGSVLDLFGQNRSLNHHTAAATAACSPRRAPRLLREFFAERREAARQLRRPAAAPRSRPEPRATASMTPASTR